MGSIDKRMKMLYNTLKLDNTKLLFLCFVSEANFFKFVLALEKREC